PVAGGEGDTVAAGGERQRDGAPDTLGGAGNECDPGRGGGIHGGQACSEESVFASEAASSTFRQAAARSTRLSRPASTRPGPTSTKWVTSRCSNSRRERSHCTGAVT